MSGEHPYNFDAQIFEAQVVITDTTTVSSTGGSLVVKGGLSTQDTYVTGHVAVNSVDITPNLNDIVYEQQAVLQHSQTNPVTITNFYFDNSVTSSFKAIINVSVTAADSKYAVWELNGVYKPTGWVMTSSFVGDVTGIYFYVVNNSGVGQIKYTNSNGPTTSTTIRYRATTTAPPGTNPTGSVGIINNTSGPFLADGLVYANTVTTLATSSDVSYNSNILKVGQSGRFVAENVSNFTNFSNGGSITSMGDASIAKKLIVGTKVGIAQTAPAFQLDVTGDINFTGNFYRNGSLYSGSSIFGTSGTDAFFTTGNFGVGTTSPSKRLDVSGDAIISGGITAGSANIADIIVSAITASSAQITAATVGTLKSTDFNASAITASSAQITAATVGTLKSTDFNASAITASSAQITAATVGTLKSTDFTASSITSSGAQITAATVGTLKSTDFTASAITSAGAQITAATVGTFFASNATFTNITSSAAVISSISATTVSSTLLAATTMTGGSLSLSGDLYIAGTLTTVNVTSTNLMNTNVTAGVVKVTSELSASGNSNTIGSIITTDENVGIGSATPSYKLHVVGDIFATGNITGFSDERLKTGIETLSDCLSKVQQLSGVSFTRIQCEAQPDVDTQRRDIGFLAQDVEAQFPELVSTDSHNGYKSVAYGNMAAVLVECIKELSAQVADLQQQVASLQK
jgi:hypothetical protein